MRSLYRRRSCCIGQYGEYPRSRSAFMTLTSPPHLTFTAYQAMHRSQPEAQAAAEEATVWLLSSGRQASPIFVTFAFCPASRVEIHRTPAPNYLRVSTRCRSVADD